MTRRPTPPAAHRHTLPLAGCVVLADQAAKLAAERLAGGHRHGLVVPLRNPRFCLGLAVSTRPLMVLAMAAGIALVAAYGVRASRRRMMPGWILALVTGGAASNLLDRLLLGAVRDFLAVGHLVVNLADLAVLTGVVGYGLTRLARPPATCSVLGREVHHDQAPPAGHHRHAAGRLACRPRRRDGTASLVSHCRPAPMPARAGTPDSALARRPSPGS